MYIPDAFHVTDLGELHTFIRENSFGILVSSPEGLQASHLPFLLDPERGDCGTLVGHMARANPQWQDFADGGPALVIFQGPHAYISPSYYDTELSVPTWNYAVVHAYGRPTLIEREEELLSVLEATVDAYEAGREDSWQLSRLPDPFIRKMMKSIIGFEIRIERLEGKFKMNQNRPLKDRQGVVKGLLGSPRDADREVGHWIDQSLDGGGDRSLKESG
jgi:transcriptional regulator